MNTQEVISKINSNPTSAKEVLANMYHGKAYVVARYNGHIDTVKKTKRGAEGYINRRQRVSYYDEMTFEMVTCGSDLEVFEIHESDIKDYKTSLVMWFEYLKDIQGHEYMYNQPLRLVEYLEVSEEVKAYVIQAIDDMKNYRGLTIIEDESNQEALEVVETIETVEESNPTDITLEVVMNDEKKGIELYFSSKPSQNVRRMLTENGFRWSKRGFWYAKQTQERLSLVDAIQSILAETNQLVAEVVAETHELIEKEETNTYNTIENSDKTVVLTSVEFVWSESGDIEDSLKVTTFAEAEIIIRNAAKHAPDNGAYDKTKFLITWNDGNTYEGRLDIVHSDMFKTTPLKSHIESFVNDVLEDDGTWYSNERKEDYKHFINTYPLEDAKKPTNEPNSQSKQSNVLDFTSKMKAKQEKEEASKMMDSFLNNILPNMTRDEQLELMDAYKTGNEKDVETIFNKILLSVSIRQAKEDFLKSK
ncbi:LPD25 domain-containing protein [Niallia alba]|uniref:LPD25 domain-containing protein n=1 Tax=Niallia alba TaxID=2729105 RepID=UPI0039A193DC